MPCDCNFIIGKTGLGRRKFLTEKRSEVKVLEAKNLSDFRLRKQAVLAQQKCKSDLRKSRLACQQLDTASGLIAPLENWYWPEELLPKPEEENDSNSDVEEDEEEEDDEELEEEEELVCIGYLISSWLPYFPEMAPRTFSINFTVMSSTVL